MGCGPCGVNVCPPPEADDGEEHGLGGLPVERDFGPQRRTTSFARTSSCGTQTLSHHGRDRILRESSASSVAALVQMVCGSLGARVSAFFTTGFRISTAESCSLSGDVFEL